MVVELALKASPPFSKILVAVDSSENSNRALEYTLKLAKLHESKVTILHVVEPSPSAPETHTAIRGFEIAVEDEAREAIREDIGRAESAVDELQQASGQINSIIIPILALISIIIALQISLFARIRASFK